MARWVFGFGGEYQLVPLMHLGFHGIPHLGLDLDGLSFHLSIGVCIGSILRIMEATFRPGRQVSLGVLLPAISYFF